MDNPTPETEEQAAARILEWRARKALTHAPELIHYVRSLIPHPERGEEHVHMWSPMRLSPTDDADQFYANLVNWVLAWADYLNTTPPAAATVWANTSDVQGFRAGTTPAGAQTLVKLQVDWLTRNREQINAHQFATEYQTNMVEILGELRGRYPTAPRPPKEVHPRPCPQCGEPAVGAEWASADVTAVLDVQIRCEVCDFTIAGKPSDIVKWIAEAPPVEVHSEECSTGHHLLCEGIHCECFCHEAPARFVGHGAPTPVRNTGRTLTLPASTAVQDPRTCTTCWLIHPAGACDG